MEEDDDLRQKIFGDSDDDDSDGGLFALSDEAEDSDDGNDEEYGEFGDDDEDGGRKKKGEDDEDYDPEIAKKRIQEMLQLKAKEKKKSTPRKPRASPAVPRKRKRSKEDDGEAPAKRRRQSKPKEPRKKKRKETLSSGEEDEEGLELTAVEKMLRDSKRERLKRKKQGQLTSDLVTSHVKEFLQLMENAVNDDLDSLEKRQPALKKLALLPRVGALSLVRAWMELLPDGTLPNIKIRTALLEVLERFAEYGVAVDDLMQSGVGKPVAICARHPDETNHNKKLARKLVDMWTRAALNVSDRYEDDEDLREEEERRRRRHADRYLTPPGSDQPYGRIPPQAPMDYVRMPQNEVRPMEFQGENEHQKRLRMKLKSLGKKRNERAITVGITKTK